MKDFIRKINYHETDKMGITHHSNYIKYMEEARIDFLSQIGYGYDKLEESGISSPVIGVECEYKQSTTFGDTLKISAEIEEYNSVRMTIKYTMSNDKTGDIVLIGKTKHCFVTREGKPVVLKKINPEFDQMFKQMTNTKC